jgi:hypothetical protein
MAIWGFERQRFKGSKQVSPFTNYRQGDSQKKIHHREGTCLRDKAIITLIHATVVNTSLINDYQYYQ